MGHATLVLKHARQWHSGFAARKRRAADTPAANSARSDRSFRQAPGCGEPVSAREGERSAAQSGHGVSHAEAAQKGGYTLTRFRRDTKRTRLKSRHRTEN